jgi:hypothetical protein
VSWEGVRLSPLGTLTTILPTVPLTPLVLDMMSVEQSMEWQFVGVTEVLEENLPLVPLYPPQIPYYLTGLEPGSRHGKPANNRLSYGTVPNIKYTQF